MGVKKIITAFKIKSDEDLKKYLFELIQQRAQEQGKDIYEVSLEDIYQTLTKARKKIPKIIFRTKISTFLSVKKYSSRLFDIVNVVNHGFLGLGYGFVKRGLQKIFAKPMRNFTISQLVDWMAKESYKPKK